MIILERILTMGGRGSASTEKTYKFKWESAQNALGTSKGDRDPNNEFELSVAARGNPNRVKGEEGYNINCQRCIVAFEARMRGYNVEALSSTPDDKFSRNNKWANFFGKKSSEVLYIKSTSSEDTKSKILNKMGEWGENSRAVLAVTWKNENYGHVVNVVNSKSGIRAYDAQIGRRISLDQLLKNSSPEKTRILRTDNANLDNKYISKAIKQSR